MPVFCVSDRLSPIRLQSISLSLSLTLCRYICVRTLGGCSPLQSSAVAMRKLSSRVKRLEITQNKTKKRGYKTDTTARQSCRNNITVPWIVNSIESVKDNKIETARTKNAQLCRSLQIKRYYHRQYCLLQWNFFLSSVFIQSLYSFSY